MDWADFAAGTLTRANGEPATPEKSRFAGGFLGMSFLMGAVVIKPLESAPIRLRLCLDQFSTRA